MANAPATHYEAILTEFRDSGIDQNLIQRWVDHEDYIVRRNRQQLVTTFPLFSALLTKYSEIPVHMEIRAAIDRGDPLIDALSSILGVSKKCIRALRGTGPALLGSEWIERPSELLDAIEMIPPEKLPRTPEEWRLFREFWVGCGEFRSEEPYCRRPSSSRIPTVMSRHLLMGLCGGGYLASAIRLRRRWHGNLQRLADVRDYFWFVGEWLHAGAELCEPSEWLRNRADGMRDELLTRYSAMELIRQSERWHQEIGLIPPAKSDAGEVDSLEQWPALPGLPLSVGSHTVVSLTNRDQLEAEGSQLNHCVGFHYPSCMRGESHIVSVRTPQGQSVSTAEIFLSKTARGTLVPTAIQHKKHSNDEPDHDCIAALNAALGVLRNEAIQAELHQILTFHAQRRERIDALLTVEMGGYPVAVMSTVMSHVLKDFRGVIAWLERRLEEEEGWYRHRNEQAGARMEALGLDDELTYERAFEIYRDTGNEECFDEGL
jgi:hypothetical protein